MVACQSGGKGDLSGACVCRASALEGLGMKAEAVRDYKAVLTLNATLTAARAGLRRLDPTAAAEIASAERAARQSAASARAVATSGGGSSAGPVAARAPSSEDMRLLAAAEANMKRVIRQLQQARGRGAGTAQEVRMLQLQKNHVTTLDASRRTFRACGRAYLLAPRDELVKRLDDDLEAAGKRKAVIDTTIHHLSARQQEAQDGWVDAYNTVRQSMGLPPAAKDAFAATRST